MTVENLEINVKTNVSGSSTKTITSLADALGQLEVKASALSGLSNLSSVLQSFSGSSIKATAFNGLAKGIENLHTSLATLTSDEVARLSELAVVLKGLDGINLSGLANVNISAKAARSLHDTSNGIEKVAKSAKKAQTPLNSFVSSLKRIAFYRFIRTVIKAITQAFQEGLENAYLFSAGLTTESHRFAEAMDSMKSSATQMKNQLGAAFIALLTAIEPVVTAIVNLVTKLADAMSQLISAFTGTTYLRAAAVSDKFADNMASGAKSAKEWKNQILGFDVINRLNEPSGGGGTGLTAEEMFGGTDAPINEKWLKIAEKIKGLFESLNFEPLLEGWEKLKTAVSELAETIGTGLAWAWENILVPLAHWTIEEAAPKVLELLAKAFGLLNAVFEKLGPILEPLWKNVLKPFFEWLGRVSMKGLEELIDLVDDLTKLINGEITWKEFIDGLDGVQIALLALGGIAVLSAIGKVITAIAKIPTSIITNTPKATTALGKMASAVAIGALAVFDAVLLAYDVTKLSEAANTYHEAQLSHNRETDTALSAYARLYKDYGKDVADEWAKMAYNIDTTNMSVEEAQQALTDKIEEVWGDAPRNWWEALKQGWDKYFGVHGSGIKDLFTDAWNGFADFYGLGKIDKPELSWHEVAPKTGNSYSNSLGTEVFGPFFNDVGEAIEEAIPDWVMKIPGVGFASGGFPTEGNLFIANEAGPELVGNIGGRTAVANNDQIVEAVSSGVYNAVSSAMGNGNKNVSVHVYLDSREIKSGQQRLARATGG